MSEQESRSSSVAEEAQRSVLLWQCCTGCAHVREVLLPVDEAHKVQALGVNERSKHQGCIPQWNALPGHWVSSGARWAPAVRTAQQAGEQRG